MNIIINENEYCKLDITYSIEKDLVDGKRDEIIVKFKDIPINGFRKGKTTPDIIKFHFRKEIEEELKRELANEAFQNVLSEKNIKPFGYPNFTSIVLDESKFACSFTMHKQPDFELKSYKGFDIPKPTLPDPEEFTQRMVFELRAKHGTSIPFTENDFVQIGDKVILDCHTTSNDQPVDKLTFSGEILQVGRINIPGFSEGLLGMQCNEVRHLELPIPDDGSEFANKILKIEAKLIMGSKIESAPLNEALAKIVGVQTVDELMDQTRAIASNRIAEIERNFKTDQVSRRLIEDHIFEVPHWIISAEAKINARYAGKEWEKISNSDKEIFIKQAENSVKLSLILEKIRENEPEAQLTQQEILSIAKANISQYAPNPDKVFGEILNSGHLSIFLNRIKDEYTLDFIVKNCNVVE